VSSIQVVVVAAAVAFSPDGETIHTEST
jgi:hypothetical protein